MPTSYPIYKDSVRNWFLQNVPLDTTILDIGAGCGTYSDLIRGYGYKMDAVEIWEPYITQYDLKNKYGRVYEDDVLNLHLNILGAYDFYILGDVLEHLSVDYAQWLMTFFKMRNKQYLVAIPYQMEQGEYEGNIHETHLQPDLTPEIMLERYPDLELLYGNNFYGYYTNKKQKHEKAYVLYADDSYYDLVDACCRSIRNFSDYPIYVYMLNSSKKVNVVNTITKRWDCDVRHLKKRNDYIVREDKQIYKLLIERPKIVKDALKYADVVAYVDTDSVASPYVDRIFDYYNGADIYPFFTAGIYDYLIINGRGGAASRDEMHTTLEYEACKLFNVDQKIARENYRQTGYFVCGQKSIWFLEEWAWMCNHPRILEDNAKYASFNEETIMNIARWKYRFDRGMPLVYVNGLRKGLDFKGYEYFMGEWFKVPAQKDDLLFYHGEKDIDKINEFIEYLKL
jgi:hypothetical protein